MKHNFLIVVFFFALCLSPNVFSGILGQNNYNDCVNDVISNSKTDLAVEVGKESCELKFNKNSDVIKICNLTYRASHGLEKGIPEYTSDYLRIGVMGKA